MSAAGGGRPRALMLQGTGSDVGKSLLAAGLCRALTRRGLSVRPFKPQNMSNNAAVTNDGGEIGRAQALQARACGVAPSVHMNPVLLKPQSDIGSQVIVQGKVWGNANARSYRGLRAELLPRVLESFDSLRAQADLVVVEGAGSPAEVNLRAGDIANMGFAEAADLPVVLVGDIDRGGVIASLVGTHALLPEWERNRIRGFLVNKFRGDPTLFDSALDLIRERTGWPSMGVVPWFDGARALPAEDAVALDHAAAPAGKGEPGGETPVRVAVPRLSRIANFDDFDPLVAEPGVRVTFVQPGAPLPGDTDLVILPGSKATIADLAFLRAQGWDIDLRAHHRRGGKILGICAGYQILGTEVADPDGIEGPPGSAPGLGLLAVTTTMGGDKTLTETETTDGLWGQGARGYEMHMGRTEGPDTARAWLLPESARSADGRVLGCYLHGLFSADGFRRALLDWARPGAALGAGSHDAAVEAALDGLADHLERHADIPTLLALANGD